MTQYATETRSLPVQPKKTYWNPSPAELREFTRQMKNARETEFRNLNVATKVVSRSKLSTYIATDNPKNHSDQTITRAEYERVALLQDDHITRQEMLVIDGFIGNDPDFRVPARLIIEKANACSRSCITRQPRRSWRVSSRYSR
jgi:ATP-dependent phosphoenolpyruvate carboxykinase